MDASHYSLILAILGIIVYYRRRVAVLSTHQGFGVLTCEAGRIALQRQRGIVEVAYCDLDRLHHLNAELGYAEVDRRVKAAFRRRSSDTVASLKASGDEFFFIVRRGQGAGLAARLQVELEARGLSATWAVVTGPAPAALDAAVAQVQAAKARRDAR